MANYKQVGILVCLLATLPVTAADGGSACTASQAQATQMGDYYERLVQTSSGTMLEIWRESNTHTGLQPFGGRCADGSRWSPDTLVFRASVGGSLGI